MAKVKTVKEQLVQYELPLTAKASEYLTLKQAAEWASEFLQKKITISNISYLVQYGLVKKHGQNGNTVVKRTELERYYTSYKGNRQVNWTKRLGDDLNWALSFEHLREADTTKHVHRLHPYKGKFIPQLVEYFLDSHTDEFKREVYFSKGDIILDPFCGSGTTLVQASELGMHGVGIDISAFNGLISNVKIGAYDLKTVQAEIYRITNALKDFLKESKVIEFDKVLLGQLASYNAQYFPSPEFRYRVKRREIDEMKYGEEKAMEFLPIYQGLVKKYQIELLNGDADNFLEKWYLKQVREEIDFVFERVKEIKDSATKKLLTIVLSRTIRSCRATTHSDLATLKEPITTTYYCHKHGKICKPLFSIYGWWERYSVDTVQRIRIFQLKRTNSSQYCLTGDSRTIDVPKALKPHLAGLALQVADRGFDGIFTSPPYVGLIDYHEQHAYAYDLFKFPRNDESEIGPLFKGSGKEARQSYVKGVVAVFKNCLRFMKSNCNIFVVANDKYNLYPEIAMQSGLEIANTYKRPVLNRTERDKGAYAESIFHMKISRAR